METKGEDIESAPAPRLAEGTHVGPYRIERVLGEGAMGLVYLATHESLSRRVAIKALKPQAEANKSLVERFLAEAVAVNIIGHENIVECTDTITHGGRTFVVMELLEGQSLRAALHASRRLAPGRAIRIAIQIARAIAAAHAKEIVHRDLKPENVFLIQRGDIPDYVKVLDFGIARLRPEHGVTATQTGALLGTPAYMSPEQVAGERATSAADIYALGIIVFELIAGRLPFVATNVGLMFAAHATEKPKRLDAVAPGIPRALADLVEQMLAKDPAARPPSMIDVEQRLAACLADADRAVVGDSLVLGETLAAAPRKQLWVPVAIALVLAGGIIAWRTMQPEPVVTPRDAAVAAPFVSKPYDPRDQMPPDDYQQTRDAYLAHVRTLFAPDGKYTYALGLCWRDHRKRNPDSPATRTIEVRFEIDANGHHGNVSTDVPPGELATCLLRKLDALLLLPPRFEVTEPIQFAATVTLK